MLMVLVLVLLLIHCILEGEAEIFAGCCELSFPVPFTSGSIIV